MLTSEVDMRPAQLAFAWPRRRIALRSRGGLYPYPPGLESVLLGARFRRLSPPARVVTEEKGVGGGFGCGLLHVAWKAQGRLL